MGAAFYDGWIFHSFAQANHDTLQYLIETIPDGTDVIDAGCGTCLLTAGLALAKKDSRIIGYDRSSQMIGATRKRINRLGITNLTVHVYAHHDLPNADIQEASADYIISNSVEIFGTEPLQIYLKLLKPEGHLITDICGDASERSKIGLAISECGFEKVRESVIQYRSLPVAYTYFGKKRHR